MKKKSGYIKFLAGGAAILILLFLAAKLLTSGSKTHFQRAEIPPALQDTRNFKFDANQGKLFYLSQGHDQQLLKLTAGDACFFKVTGKKTVEFASPISGQVGFFCQFYIQARNHGRINFKIEALLAKRTLTLHHEISREQYVEFVRPLRLAAGDRVRVTFKGDGIACFSQPIFYRIRQPRERSYVFLIGVDTLRGDHIGMKVNGRSLTPRIDSLQKDAATFSSCFAQSDWTLPSFMNLFTAQYEFNHQVRHGSVLAPEKPFLVRELGQRFMTFNLNGGGFVSKNFGFSRHFDYFDTNPHYGDPNGGQLLFQDALRLVDAGMFPEAFFFLHTYQVHTPFQPPPKFLHEINPAPRTGKLNSVTYGSQQKRFMPGAAELVDSYKELYQAEVLAFDSYLGDFVDALKKRGIYGNSMIIIMADHGEEFLEHGGWGHGHSMYDELLRVPLIIKFPGEKFSGRLVSDPVGVIDIIPTIMDSFGIAPAGKKVDGLSLLPLLRGGELRREHLFSSVSTCWYIEQLPAKFAVIDGDHKVIFNYEYPGDSLKYFEKFGAPPRTGPVEIYDLGQDRNETRNLYPQRSDIYRRLLHVIRVIKARINLNFKTKDKGPDAQIDEELQRQMKTLGYL